MGYISVSKYDKDLDSQKRLLKDLISLSSVELYGDIENDTYDVEDECQEFKFHNNEYWDGGSKFLEHGESYTVETEENCLYVDGRCSPHNNDVADDFWMHGFDEGGWLKEIDPDDTIAVYHRKGKDFYIGYTLEVEEQELIWREEDESYDVDDYESDTFFYASYTPDDEKIEKVKECLESMKEDFEFRSYINNELEMDSYDDCNDWSYNDGVFDLYLLDLIFNDRNEIKNWVFEVIDTSDKTTKEACIEANNKLIAEHVTFNVDMSIEVEHVDYFSTKEPTKETYNQLKVIKRLQNRLGYELVWSLVNARGNTYGFAIKQDDQEYHFELKELFEEDVNPIEFVQDCLVAINRRRIESISIAELVEKASHVFVGIDDSYAVGNCEFGTREFINRHRIDTNVIGGIRGDALLELETSQFTKNMVMHKIVQISHNGGVAC
jgi:predicted Zn-ribbon and HTH transcriptional regulator